MDEKINTDDEEIPKMGENLLDPEKKLLDTSPQRTVAKRKTGCLTNLFYNIFPCFKHVDLLSQRKCFLRDQLSNYTEWSNKVENHKYNLISFIPVVIFNQFKQFGNFFYLIMTASQFVNELKVGFLFTYCAPLGFVVAVSMLKELYDDVNRRIQDKRTNSTLVNVLGISENIKDVKIYQKKAADLQIGDIIELKKNSRVPADIVVLKTYNESDDNQSFIRTDQLDGETDWKLRKAPGITQDKTEREILGLNAWIDYEPPNKEIYNFKGNVVLPVENSINQMEPLNLENTMWASTVLASQKILGIVIYTGKETRAVMNNSTPKLKIGILDQELNRTNVYLFVIMVFISLLITVLKGLNINLSLFLTFFKFIVLFCSIIPISLRVNLDVSKTWFSLVINRDKSIPETIARNSTIPEELGRISYVFSDKTGTLTKNEMIFKKIAMETESFGEENFKDLTMILEDECRAADAPVLDLYNQLQKEKEKEKEELVLSKTTNNGMSESSSNDLVSSNTEIVTNLNAPSTKMFSDLGSKKSSKKIRRGRNKIIRDTISCMVLCNNVTPVIDDLDPEKITYQASSPDEVALVKFAESLNMKLISRTDKEIRIKDTQNNIEEFTVLANFPFSSDTKRMGIILQNKKYGHIIFYLKGAENVMMRYVKNDYISYIKEHTENLASKGLRTLVLTQRILSQNEYDGWKKKYDEAASSMDDRNERIREAVSLLEKDMDFLCVTGVEDLLQDEVATTIDNMRNAGMKVWMLTGDKVETATCISISAGLKAKNHKIYTIRYDDLPRDGNTNEKVAKLKEYLLEYNKKSIIDPHLFIVDGQVLDLALKNCESDFFQSAMDAPSVVCCRCSPTQKRIIVKTIKKYTDARTAAVGDGGNDVAMIQEADVGIGIVGKEGLQASLAADYSIKEFKSLSILLLWWGRIAYKNTSVLANFVIHRGLIISFNQFIFSLMFYYNAVALYNGFLCFGYSTIFTCFPSISILLDRDVDKSNVLKFPTLYKILLKGRELNLKNFLWWLFKSIFQSAIIMFGSIVAFEDQLFLKIVTVSFTALIYLEVLNVYMEINKFHWFMIVSLSFTFIIYTLTLLFLNSYLDIYYVFKSDIFWKILLISLIAWLPFYITSRVKKYLFPQTIEKLNQGI